MLCEFEFAYDGAGGWMIMGSGPPALAPALAPVPEPEPEWEEMGYGRLRFVSAAPMFGFGFGFGYVSERWDAGAGGGGAKYTGSGGGLEGAFEKACDCDCEGCWDACVRATDADLRESGRGTLPCDGTWFWLWL